LSYECFASHSSRVTKPEAESLAYFSRSHGGDSRQHLFCADSYHGIAFIGDWRRAVSPFADSGGLEHFHLSLLSTAFRASGSLDFTRCDDSLVYISWEC